MSGERALEALIIDLVEWVAGAPRPYRDVMDAWATSCPRLPVWEEAVGRGLLICERVGGEGILVKATPAGIGMLQRLRGGSR